MARVIICISESATSGRKTIKLKGNLQKFSIVLSRFTAIMGSVSVIFRLIF